MKLSKLGDYLDKLSQDVNFELFRGLLRSRLPKLAKAKGGQFSYDYALMFKILLLQRYYNLPDNQIEYQINDRLSFMRFLNLTISDDILDSNTVWHFTERLKDLSLTKELFYLFGKELKKLRLIVNKGGIINASFAEAHQQRNTCEVYLGCV
ncbi:MAG: transposase [Tenacibaculum sp.]